MLYLFGVLKEKQRSKGPSIKLSKDNLAEAIRALFETNNLIQVYHNRFNKLVFDDQPNSLSWPIVYIKELSNILAKSNEELSKKILKQTSEPISYRRLWVFGNEFSREFFKDLKKIEKSHTRKKLTATFALGLLLFFVYVYMVAQDYLKLPGGQPIKKILAGIQVEKPMTNVEFNQMLEFSPQANNIEEPETPDLNFHAKDPPVVPDTTSDLTKLLPKAPHEETKKPLDSVEQVAPSKGDEPTNPSPPDIIEHFAKPDLDPPLSGSDFKKMLGYSSPEPLPGYPQLEAKIDQDKPDMSSQPEPSQFPEGPSSEIIFKSLGAVSIMAEPLDLDVIQKSSYVDGVRKKISSTWYQMQSFRELDDLLFATEFNKKTVVSFNISPKGFINHLTIEKSTGSESVDNIGVRAVTNSTPFPKFPQEFKFPNLHVEIHFKYSSTG